MGDDNPMSDARIDESEIVGSLSHEDRTALACFTAAQALHEPPSWESLPLLSEVEYEMLLALMRGISGDLRETAGARGADLWRSVQ